MEAAEDSICLPSRVSIRSQLDVCFDFSGFTAIAARIGIKSTYMRERTPA